MRTGIEPFFLLNAIWVVGSSRTSTSLSCAASCALSLVDRENEHVAADHVASGCLPTMVQPYSLPGVWPAA